MRTKRNIAAAAGLAAAVALAVTGPGALGEWRAERTLKRQTGWAKANLGGAGLAAASKGGDPDAGSHANKPSESGEGDRLSSLFQEQAALRAYPADTVSADQISGAARAFESIKIRGNSGSKKGPLLWNAIGPTVATQPGVLNFTGRDYVTAGRVTALLVDRTCNQGRCRLWMGAAGGGIWRTDKALHTNNPGWSFSSDGMQSNAIGTLTQDPSDPSGDTLYAGTGEPNNSGDSEAGLGMFKSTDGGKSWVQMPSTLPMARSRAISSIVVDPTNPQIIYMGTALAVRGIASSGGAVRLGGLPDPGVYKSADGGTTWTLVWSTAGTRGVTDIALDPLVPSTVYASAYQRGIYRSAAGGAFQQIFSGGNPGSNVDRTQLAVTVKAATTRIYATNGNTGSPAAALYRVDDASALAPGSPNTLLWKKLSSTSVSDLRFPTGNFCTGQCWYDQDVQTPPGEPDTVYVLGSYQYGDLGNPVGNARAVLRSTTAGEADPTTGTTFTDMTVDSQGNTIHPDQHSIAFSPQNPNVFWEGSDGGVVRSSGTFTDASSQCTTRPLSTLAKAACARMLSAVPTSLYSLNEGLTTLQFQSISVNPKNPTGEIMGGTQDNGTWLYSGSSRGWVQSIYGDGGQSGFDAVNPAIRFNTFFTQATDTNFRNGDPTKWVITSAPLFNGGESSLFYMPIIADPVVGGSMFAGLQSVWRTKDNGGDQTYLEANCPEFTTDAAQPGCGDWVPLGTKLTTISGTKFGGNVAAVERAPGDSTTLWAATTPGRVFISRNAAAEPASAVTFARLDLPTSPNRFVTGISIDPADANHAFVSYSGYNSATPSTPGHVFDVRVNPTTNAAAWTDISYNLSDLPVTDVAYDNVTGDLYAACDFGVLRLAQGRNTWEVAGSGLPIVETPGLTIVPGARRLYAATHGMGAFFMNLP